MQILGLDADFQASGMDVDKYLNALTGGLIKACGAGPITPHEYISTRWSS
jgi:hypothetical protein